MEIYARGRGICVVQAHKVGIFLSMITNRNRDIYKGGEKNMLNNMSVGGYILAVFGIKE